MPSDTPSPEATRAAERINARFIRGLGEPFDRVPWPAGCCDESLAEIIDAEYAALRERVERLERAIRRQRAYHAYREQLGSPCFRAEAAQYIEDIDAALSPSKEPTT